MLYFWSTQYLLLPALFALNTVSDIFFGFEYRTRTQTSGAALLTHCNHGHRHLVRLAHQFLLFVLPHVAHLLQLLESGLLFSNEALLSTKQLLKIANVLAQLLIGDFLFFQQQHRGFAVNRRLGPTANRVLVSLGQQSTAFDHFTTKGAHIAFRNFGHG